MREIFVISFLSFNAWKDLRKKEISMVSIILFGVTGIIGNAFTGKISWQNLICVAISCFFIILSIVTRGGVGMGDGLILLTLGILLNVDDFMITLLLGMICCAVWAGILLGVLHKGRKTEIPFVPFLLLGYIGGMFL